MAALNLDTRLQALENRLNTLGAPTSDPPPAQAADTAGAWQQVFNDLTSQLANIEQRLDAKFHEVDAALVEELCNRSDRPSAGPGESRAHALIDEHQARDIVRFEKGYD